MTGLDPETDAIIEIYCIITDGQLKLLDESGWGTVVHQTKEKMGMMDEWCTRVRMSRPMLLFVSGLDTSIFHPARGSSSSMGKSGWGTVAKQSVVDGESGLTAAVIQSPVTPQQAADGLLAYIQKYIPERGQALLSGNSVHADQAFLRKGPYRKVLDHLHYRILDVSSIKEAARRWW